MDRGSGIFPNPTLPIVSDLASSCEEKMQSLDEFLAEFVDDKDGVNQNPNHQKSRL